jgi:hypothetical protein
VDVKQFSRAQISHLNSTPRTKLAERNFKKATRKSAKPRRYLFALYSETIICGLAVDVETGFCHSSSFHPFFHCIVHRHQSHQLKAAELVFASLT